jgi:hypothetical protein
VPLLCERHLHSYYHPSAFPIQKVSIMFCFATIDASGIPSADNVIVSSASRHRTFSAVDTLAAVATAEMASDAADWADALLAMCNGRGGDDVSGSTVGCRVQRTDSSADRQQKSQTLRCCASQKPVCVAETFWRQELEVLMAPDELDAAVVCSSSADKQDIVMEPVRCSNAASSSVSQYEDNEDQFRPLAGKEYFSEARRLSQTFSGCSVANQRNDKSVLAVTMLDVPAGRIEQEYLTEIHTPNKKVMCSGEECYGSLLHFWPKGGI